MALFSAPTAPGCARLILTPAECDRRRARDVAHARAARAAVARFFGLDGAAAAR